MEQVLRNLTFGKAMIVSLVIAGLYYMMLYDNGEQLQNSINATRSQYNELDSEIKSIREAIKDAERFQQTMSVLGVEMGKVTKALPIDLSSPEFMRIVSNEAKNVGVQINSLAGGQSYGGTEDKADIFEKVGVNISISGLYNQVMAFMSNLTKLDIIVTINSLQMNVENVNTSTGTKESAPHIGFTASLNAYKLKKIEEEKKAGVK